MALPITTNATYNTDVYGLVRRINRFIEEISLSQSSGVAKTSVFDVARAKSYITAVRTYMGWVLDQPELDLPETGPKITLLPTPPVIPPMENESLYDLAVLLEIARDELANSQSSRMSSNLIAFDAGRLTSVLAKADAFITDYITVVDPLDLPESSPGQGLTGPGKGGV
jgi:hypothetical protein